jgi:hypothetical protein
MAEYRAALDGLRIVRISGTGRSGEIRPARFSVVDEVSPGSVKAAIDADESRDDMRRRDSQDIYF